jgi:hypothetical protein
MLSTRCVFGGNDRADVGDGETRVWLRESRNGRPWARARPKMKGFVDRGLYEPEQHGQRLCCDEKGKGDQPIEQEGVSFRPPPTMPILPVRRAAPSRRS